MQPSERVRAIIPVIRKLFDEEVYPLEPRFLSGSFRDLLPRLGELRAKVKSLGLWAPHLPVSLGGMGLPLSEFAHLGEELGKSPIGHYLFNCQAPDMGNMELLLAHGTEEQKARYLAPLARGDIRSCFSMTEPDRPGSNPTWLDTRAEKDGADYVITGRKWFTSGADGAAFAIVMAVTDASASAHLRASQIIVPTDTPGFQLLRNIPVMGHAGDDYPTHGEILYQGVRVPQSNRIGGEGAGFALAQERLGPGRIHHCMRWIGICQRALDLMCRRAARRQLSPGKPLGTKQTVQEWIAESRAEIFAARLAVLYTADKIDREGAYAAREEISLIKFHVADVLMKVLDRAIQVHGALGITDETPLAFWYRHERGARIYDGPDEVHKSVVAKRLLKTYGIEVGVMDHTDAAAPVREGQGFDLDRLAAHLQATLGETGPLVVEQFPRGYSNLTYLLKLGGRELVLRRAPPGVKIKSAHDMAREHKILSHLSAVWPKAPRPLFLCEDESIVGTPFYVMERVRGVILRSRVPDGLELGPERMRTISESVIDTLAEIHTLDYRAAGLADLGKPEGYVRRQLEGWTDRYRKAQTDEIPTFEEVGKWLFAHQPADSGAALIHNDYKYDNVVLDDTVSRVVAVLDWEMATLGDPLMDLGTTLGYWVEAADPPVFQVMQFGLTHLPGNLTRAQVVERYSEKTGREVKNVLYYYVYALYKLSVVAQQLYRRYRDGLTKEARYAPMLEGVKAVTTAALHAIARERIDWLAEP